MLKIKEEFKKLIPALTKEEFKQLEDNCMAEGIREKILTWNGFIIDGHNRYEISQKWDLDFETENKHFDSEEDVRKWMILNQFGRRNLSNYQRSVLALELEEVFSEIAKKNQGTRTDIGKISCQSEISKIESEKESKKKKIWDDNNLTYDVKRRLTDDLNNNAAYHKKKINTRESQLLYIAKAGDDIKIGISQFPENRIKQLQTSNSKIVELLFEIEGGLELEKILHKKFNEYNVSGEWFNVSDDVLSRIISYAKRESERINKTTYQLSKVASVSHDTIAKVKKIQEKATDEIKEKLSTGEVSINAAYKEIKKEEKKKNFETKKELFAIEVKPENLNQTIILGDSVKVLPTLQPKSFDLLLSDPPYGMDFKSGWNTKDKIANDKIVDTVSLFENVLRESVPLLKDDAHFYLFGNINFIGDIRPIIEKYLNLKNILIWDRKVIGMGDLKSYGNSYDIIYFGYNKVWKDLNGTRDRDLLSYSRVDPAKNIHPTEKPLDILEYLIKKSSNENDKILEPFAGGGSTLKACKNLNRLATGIEIEENYYNLIKERI